VSVPPEQKIRMVAEAVKAVHLQDRDLQTLSAAALHTVATGLSVAVIARVMKDHVDELARQSDLALVYVPATTSDSACLWVKHPDLSMSPVSWREDQPLTDKIMQSMWVLPVTRSEVLWVPPYERPNAQERQHRLVGNGCPRTGSRTTRRGSGGGAAP
jgi:hypothetical protein